MVVNCDNLASCLVLNKGSTKCTFMQACLRHICYSEAMGEFEIKAKHIREISNRVPNLLSRWHLDDKYSKELMEIFVGTEFFVSNEYFLVEDLW